MPSLVGSRSSRATFGLGGWSAYLFGYWLSVEWLSGRSLRSLSAIGTVGYQRVLLDETRFTDG